MTEPTFLDLVRAAEGLAGLLRKANQKIAVSESASGGLINAALVGVDGASDFYVGGMIVYTSVGRKILSHDQPIPRGMKGATELFARYQAERASEIYETTWGIGETGATGPQGNPYGDPPGHGWVACVGPVRKVQKLSIPDNLRVVNMHKFALAAIELASQTVKTATK